MIYVGVKINVLHRDIKLAKFTDSFEHKKFNWKYSYMGKVVIFMKTILSSFNLNKLFYIM